MFTLQRKVVTAFLAGAVVLAFVGVVASRSMARLAGASEAIQRTERLLRQLEETYSQIADAETASRGYVLTGDPSYLDAYGDAVAALPAQMGELRRLAAGSPRRVARVRLLEPLVERRTDAIRVTVRRRSTDGVATAVANIRTGRGKALMDSIRVFVDEMEREEEALRQAEAVQARIGVRRVTGMLAVGLSLALAISLLAAAAVRRELTAHERTARALRAAKETAEAANRAKSDFLARMSHELRTPLNSIIGFSNVMLRRGTGTLPAGTAAQYLQRIRDNGMHLLVLIDDLLDMARIDVGHIQIHLEPVALDALVREVVGSFEVDARTRGLALAAELPPRLAPIDTDPARLRQVLTNLVSNALKFTARGGVTVRIAADPATDRPRTIEVADTGIGIAPERQQAVFDAFEQADTSTVRRFGGTGLGLAISRALCDLLDCRLELRSVPGEGSTFTVALPPAGADKSFQGNALADSAASPGT